MSIRPYYTSNSLIEAVKRKISFPISQNTFSDQDILNFANEEMMLAQVPSILQYHEEYLVYTKEVPLITGVSRYQIPERAIGMKLRDLFYKDLQGQLREMNKINPDDKAGFVTNSNITQTPLHYYIENNTIVIVPSIGTNSLGSFVFSYYLRPNSLVPDSEAAICTAFSKAITVDITTMITGDSISIGSEIMVAGTDFAIGANSSITATNMANHINNTLDTELSASASGPTLTITYETRTIQFSTSNTLAFVIPTTITIVCSNGVPSSIVGNSYIDILQTAGGHATFDYDIRLSNNAVSPTSITLPDSSLSNQFVVGDYICPQYLCIVPQVPTDLHNLLAERTCARILEALGDQAGLQTANNKIKELEYSQATLIDSRVEGSPQKVLNTHSLLRYGKIRRGRW